MQIHYCFTTNDSREVACAKNVLRGFIMNSYKKAVHAEYVKDKKIPHGFTTNDLREVNQAIISFLPKIIGRNEDFSTGSAWGASLKIQSRKDGRIADDLQQKGEQLGVRTIRVQFKL
jgi:hypothetical protein